MSRLIGAHLVVEKNEVHLDKDEGHSRGWRQGQHDVVALGVYLEFEVLSEF